MDKRLFRGLLVALYAKKAKRTSQRPCRGFLWIEGPKKYPMDTRLP